MAIFVNTWTKTRDADIPGGGMNRKRLLVPCARSVLRCIYIEREREKNYESVCAVCARGGHLVKRVMCVEYCVAVFLVMWSVFTCPVSCADIDPARAVRGAVVRGARRASVSVGVCVCLYVPTVVGM